MTKSRAEYMRDYRAKQRARVEFKRGEVAAVGQIMAGPQIAALQKNNKHLADRLEAALEEIKRLKQELANSVPVVGRGARFPVEPLNVEFRPVPKPTSKKK